MKDKLNENIKDAFDGLEEDIGPELIWSGINAKLEESKKKKRRIFVWWFFGLGLGMTILLSIAYMNFSTPAINDKAITNIKKERPINTNQKDVKQPNQFDDNRTDDAKTELEEIQNEDHLKNGVERKTENLLEVERSKPLIDEDALVGNGIDNSYFPTIKQQKSIVHDRIVAQDKKMPALDDQNLINGRSKRGTLNILNLDISEVDLLIANVSRPELTEAVNPFIEIERKAKDTRFFSAIELYGGLSLGEKLVSSSDFEYSKKRNESEQLLERLGLGLRMEMIKYHDFTLLVGANYSRLTDKWVSTLEYVEDMPITYVDYKTELPDGFIEDHFTSDTLEHEIIRYLEQYNSEQILSLPLELRYGKRINNWTFAIGVGVDFNYLFASEHKILGLNGLPVIETKESQWLSPSVSMGLHTSYALTSSWEVTANLNYRRLSVQSENIVTNLNSRYRLFGMEIGISRKLCW